MNDSANEINGQTRCSNGGIHTKVIWFLAVDVIYIYKSNCNYLGRTYFYEHYHTLQKGMCTKWKAWLKVKEGRVNIPQLELQQRRDFFVHRVEEVVFEINREEGEAE